MSSPITLSLASPPNVDSATISDVVGGSNEPDAAVGVDEFSVSWSISEASLLRIASVNV